MGRTCMLVVANPHRRQAAPRQASLGLVEVAAPTEHRFAGPGRRENGDARQPVAT
jgi:hypothetical protein